MTGRPLILGDDGGGWRQFLDGKPISCGSTLELAEKAYRKIGDDEEFVFTGKFVTVRYEVAWSRDGERIPKMHKIVAGYEFVATIESYHHFRWPEGK